MKQFGFILILALACCTSMFAQGVLDFTINFGGTPPPHTPGLAEAGAQLTGDSLYAAIYLDNTAPTSARILELEGGHYTTLFVFNSPVWASYPAPVGTTAFSYEQTWQLTGSQIQHLMAGEWYAEVTYADTSFRGQILLIPEPSSFTLFLVGLPALAAYARRSGRARG